MPRSDLGVTLASKAKPINESQKFDKQVGTVKFRASHVRPILSAGRQGSVKTTEGVRQILEEGCNRGSQRAIESKKSSIRNVVLV